MKLKPLGARALVKMVESEEQTARGIVLPDTAREKPQTAEVVTVGDSEEVKVSAGDVVVLAKYSGTEVKIDGEEHLIVDADDIPRSAELCHQRQRRDAGRPCDHPSSVAVAVLQHPAGVLDFERAPRRQTRGADLGSPAGGH